MGRAQERIQRVRGEDPKKRLLTPRPGLFLLTALLLAAFIAAPGCSAKKEGPLALVPEPVEAKGYGVKGAAVEYSNGPLVVSVEQVGSEKEAGSELAGLLLKGGHVLLRMEIRNDSVDKTVIFNPSMTALKDDEGSYRKPFDYTDLYELARALKAEAALKASSRDFFDSNVTVPPGGRVFRLLAFKALSNEASSAELSIKDLYAGTDALDLSFRFALKEASGGK